jgi:galactonate dehydratase
VEITGVKVWLVEGIKYNWTLLRVETDAGVCGVGEATNWPGSPMIEAAVRHAGERIVGLDPRRIDPIWTKLYRDLNWVGPAGVSLCAISGIDMALLDLNAKLLGVPCYRLLGGAYRTRLPLYANYWFTEGGHDPESYARQARRVVERGFTALKFDPFAHVNYFYEEHLATNLGLTPEGEERAEAIVRAVREAVGPGVEMAIDTHALLNGATALRMADRLAPYDLMWYEEPAPPENPEAFAAMRARLPVPVAAGERHYTRFGVRALLEAQAVDYLMPDVTRCGGPSEMKRMATLAETYNVPIAPHNPNGPLSTLASAHVCAAIPNFFRLEFMLNDVPWRDEVISHPLQVEQGHLVLSDRPGLGVDLVDAAMAAHPGVLTPRDGFYV